MSGTFSYANAGLPLKCINAGLLQYAGVTTGNCIHVRSCEIFSMHFPLSSRTWQREKRRDRDGGSMRVCKLSPWPTN